MNQLLAFEVEINSMVCVVFAATDAQARWTAVKGYWEAGYGRQGAWPRPKASRLPYLDKSALRSKGRRGWDPNYAKDYPMEDA